MRIHILQHSKDTPPGYVAGWFEQNHLKFHTHRLFAGESIPEAKDVDWLIGLGGPMNIDEDARYPFLKQGKELIAEILKQEKPYLGLCLGSQMLARTLGASVRKHTDWEVGWHPVQIQNDILGLSARSHAEDLNVFQYHQDTFDIPFGAQRFATNKICANQGFIYQTGIALQFHPEADESWVLDCANDPELPHGRYVQTPAEMTTGLKFLSAQQSWFSVLMDSITAMAQARAKKNI